MKVVMVVLAVGMAAGGCMERRIHVTSEPAGATVWLNDVEVGRTPLTTGFRYYGTYDVRVRKDGFEPVWTGMTAWTPLWEVPPVDLVATALPMRIQNQVDWHVELQPTPAEEAGPLVERGRELKAKVSP